MLSSDKPDSKRKQGKKSKDTWVLKIILLSFVISIVMSSLSTAVLEDAAPFWMYAVLLIIILIGVLFDVIGVAVTAADEAPFHAMAAKKKPSAKIAISLLKNADKVSNFCNDVIGDICGIVSGAAASAIILTIPSNHFFWNLLFTGLVASMTVGGKALGKTLAIKKSEKIVLQAANVLFFMKRILHIKG